MKKLIAILLTFAAVLSLASCALIRKATSESGKPESSAVEDSESWATDFSETEPDETDSAPIRYTEDQAYELLTHSFPDYDMDLVKIERTGNIVAENSGTEYYIYNVALPKQTETEEPETDQNGETLEAESKEVEMEPAVPYYVSVNGVVHTEIVDNNVDTDYCKNAFSSKHGQTNETSGLAYKLVYEGLLQSRDNLCYNFAVYEVDNTGEESKDIYSFNFLVTIDGKMSAETTIDH